MNILHSMRYQNQLLIIVLLIDSKDLYYRGHGNFIKYAKVIKLISNHLLGIIFNITFICIVKVFYLIQLFFFNYFIIFNLKRDYIFVSIFFRSLYKTNILFDLYMNAGRRNNIIKSIFDKKVILLTYVIIFITDIINNQLTYGYCVQVPTKYHKVHASQTR